MFDRIAAPDQPSQAPVRFQSGEALDCSLIERIARQRDQRAFEQLYARHAAAVTSVAFHITHDRGAAEDIAQQVFLSLWQRADRLVAKTIRVRSWLTTVARNAAIDHLRASEPMLELDHAIVADEASDPVAAALSAIDAEALRAAVATLPEAQRRVVELICFDGCTCSEAASATGAPVGTIKSRLRLAVQHLRVALSA